MKSTTAIFGILIGCTIFATSSVSADDLRCWVCSSILDPKCNDDDFPGEASQTILKSDCKNVPSPSISGPIKRTVDATTCLKNTLSAKGITIVTRGCASPGDIGIEDPKSTGCNTVTSADGSGSSKTCLCSGDFCNGSEALKLKEYMTILPIGIATLCSRFLM